jgi:hypothetical protein
MTEKQSEYKTKKFHDPLDDVLDRPIAFNPSFKKITKSTNAALLLSQGFYWSKRTKDTDGWFYKTRLEWMDETGLTEAELDGAREKCREAGVIEEKLKGVPATLHYRVNKQKVYELLGFQIPTFPESRLPGNSQIPEKPESESYGDFNKESDTTSKNTSSEKDFVDGYLELSQAPGIKRQVRIDAILGVLGTRLNVNTSARRRQWEDFAKFIDDRQQNYHEDLGHFIDWLKGRPGFDISFWPPAKMQEQWPQAFIEEKSFTPIPTVEETEKNITHKPEPTYTPMPDSVRAQLQNLSKKKEIKK